jgi:RimJ/RimL family protein N-acetyltransferase
VSAVGFRRITRDDLPLLHGWLQREHVARWWNERSTYDEVERHYLPAIEGREPTDHYLILLDGEPAGFIQTYLVSDYPEHAAQIGLGEGVAGVDLFLGEERLLGRGLGSGALRAFVIEIVFSRPETGACVADPDVRNVASVRAFEKAGFRSVRVFEQPGEESPRRLMRLDRP